ncbi:MAG: metallophosphoesterase [Myxococcales bacterium FL481]|nr:MAG: metallophosphoesterase [Myxococcales bacterium FL481]
MRFALIILVWFAGHFYVQRRLVRTLPGSRWRRWTTVAVALAAVLPLLAMTLWRTTPDAFGVTALSWLGFWSFGLSSVVFAFVLVRDGLLSAVALVGRLRRRRGGSLSPPDVVADPERRRLFSNTVNMGIVGGAVSMSAVGGAHVTTTPAIKRLRVPIEGLPRGLEGFRIAQLTDVHIGPTIRGGFLRGVVEAVNAEGPDLVAVTGDLVDGHVRVLGEHVRPLAGLRAPHGVFFVTGNHEYYWRAEEWIAFLRELGLEVLLNEHRVITHAGESLVVAGVTDLHGGASAGMPSDPAVAVAGAPRDAVKLLLAHQPRSVFAAERAGVDLQLSGHTHGGQYFPFNLLIHLVQPYVRGLHRHGRSWVYVSCGTGYWGPPMRVGAPAEITLVELVAAEGATARTA